MNKCIICRKIKSDFNDEHVIPDSIQGYYHIKKVCKDCNSKMGSKIDDKLTNHKFIEFQRNLLELKGKSGAIPNPFSGTHTIQDDPEQKIQLIIDKDGKFIPKFIPKVPKTSTITDKFTIVIDKKEETQLNIIVDKFLQRNGISKNNIKQEKKYKSEKPWIHMQMIIDIHSFKMGILKIAYEFTVDQIPEYFDDPAAIEISKILFNVDFEALKDNMIMFGDGFNKKVLDPFAHLIDFENNNHYLILCDLPDLGLLCFINLFNTFSIAFRMSEKTGYIKDSLIIGKNDIQNKSFKVLNINQLIQQTYTPIEYRFQYYLPDNIAFKEFLINDRKSNFSFYKENDQVPFYFKDGVIAYKNIDIKLRQSQLQNKQKGDIKNEIITEFILDEELYIKLLPINKLFRVISVQIEQYKKNKI